MFCGGIFVVGHLLVGSFSVLLRFVKWDLIYKKIVKSLEMF